MVTTATVDGKYVPGMITGELGKSVAGGIGKLEITTEVICYGTGTTVDDGTDDGTFEAEIITPVVDGTVITVTVDGTTEAGTNTGVDGKNDAGGNDNVTILGGLDGTGTVETIYELTTGTFDGISDNGTDDGIIVVTDGAIIIVFDVVKV
jgi:hypothetical protein